MYFKRVHEKAGVFCCQVERMSLWYCDNRTGLQGTGHSALDDYVVYVKAYFMHWSA